MERATELPAEAMGTRATSPRLERRRVLVIGGGSQPDGPDAVTNNGGAISRLAARQGAAVAVADISEEAAEQTVATIAAEAGGPAAAGGAANGGGSATPIVADVGDPAACDRLIEEAVGALGGLDGVVLNVGIGEGLGIEGTTDESWDRVLAVNLRAHFSIVKRAFPHLEAGSSIVFVGSLAGLRPGSFSPSYDASKAALIGLCRHTALEGAWRGVRANVLAPGLIDTPLGRAASAANPARDKAPIPLGRQGTAWEVAYAATFLLSDEASYITGQTIVVDGGLGNLVSAPRAS